MFSKETFDLAFLDIKMPHFSGTEVLKQIRQNGINTPIIIITAYATVKNAVACTQMGAVGYLQKPFTSEKVRNVLREFEEERKPEEMNGSIYLLLSSVCKELGHNDDSQKYIKIYECLNNYN